MDFSLLLVVAVITPLSCLLLLILVGKKKPAAPPQRRGGGKLLPPSPPGLPVLGHLHLLGSLPHRALRSLARAHGPVLLLRFGRVPTVLVSSAAGAEELMRTRDLAFASRPRNAVAERLLYGRDVAFAPYGEYWRQARRVCVVHLLSPRRVQSFRHVREQEAAEMVGRVRAKATGNGAAGGGTVDLSELLTEYSYAVVSRAAFGDECARALLDGADRGRHLRRVLTEFQTLLGTEPVGELLPWLGWVDVVRGLEGRIRRTFEALDGLVEKVIDDHRQRQRRRPHQNGDDDDGSGGSHHHRDLVDVLLDAHNMDEEYGGVQFETNEIKAIILQLAETVKSAQYLMDSCTNGQHRSIDQDMFTAGTDTVTTVMEWAMAELITHPHALRRLRSEIRSTSSSGGGGSSKVPCYLPAVVKETLRLHAPVPLLVPREAAADAEILGYHVPARARVVVNAWAIGRDPATWGDDAEEFVPERFLGRCSDVDFRGQHFELVPFGAGRRACPGVGFAVASIETALASLLCHFDWEAPPGGKKQGAALDMSEMNGINVHIKARLTLAARPWIP
ncbi:hypothetical protein U9M48_021302 [Paspalum notatum var. saurae]|uniref:Cytochrome P450 71A1 n=1 Tax=Paspalum notatum var. saurae TaxID=547442 RepID=A0AAQ3TIG7_PASNO